MISYGIEKENIYKPEATQQWHAADSGFAADGIQSIARVAIGLLGFSRPTHRCR